MPTISEKRVFGLLSTLYENASHGTSDFWTTVYAELAELLDSGPGSVSLYVASERKFKILATNTDPSMFEEYHRNFQHISPFRDKIIGLKTGEYFSRIDHCSDEEFEKLEIYQQHFRKHSVFRYEYHVLYRSTDITGGISFSRPRSRPEFSENERKALTSILPHLQRVFQLHVAVTEVKRENQHMSEALGRMHQSVIVVDKSSRIVFMNPAARKIIEMNDGLAIDRNRTLFATTPGSNREVRKHLHWVFGPDNGDSRIGNGMVRLERTSGLRPMQAEITRFSEQDFRSYSDETLAMIFVYDPEQNVEGSETLLDDLYGLTPAEARLAVLLAQGKSLQEACDLLNVTLNTARTHLKHIFSKTDTNRQSELVRLVLSGLGVS